MERKYKTLETIAGLYRILALLVGTLGTIGGVLLLFSRGMAAVGVLTLVSVVMATLGLLAVSEFITLMMDIEEHTKDTRDYLALLTRRRRSG